jgi:cytochrome P450
MCLANDSPSISRGGDRFVEVAQFGVRRLLDADVLDNPFATYRIMRERDPVAWDSDLQAWVVTGYPESVAVLRDTESFCSDFRRLGESTPTSMLSIQSLDPPEHAAIRGLMVEAVRAVDGEDLARLVAETVAEQLDVVTGVGTFDFVGMFAEPIALRLITGVLGVPAPDPEWFTPVSHAVVDAMDGTLRPECVEAGLAARTELAALAGDWLDSPPELGLIAHVAGSARRGGVERDVLLNTLRAVLHAGFESASRFLALACLAVLRLPAGRRFPAHTDLAVNELVRYAGSVQADSRGCVRDTRLGDHVVHRGEIVTLLLGAANRDPRAFEAPDELRLDRAPNHHLGFGRGAHACLGAAIAVRLATAMFRALANSCPDIELVGRPVVRTNATLRGLARLDVRIPTTTD